MKMCTLFYTATGQEKEQARQIFTSTAASGILTNDLIGIMEQEQVSSAGSRQATKMENFLLDTLP